MGQSRITFYVDIISPFGYIAYWMLRNSPAFASVNITYMPVLLGGIHKLCSNTAPVFIKNKDIWINKERKRWAELFNIPLRADPPKGFPMSLSTVNIMRALTALHSEIDNDSFAKVVDVLWAGLWCPDNVPNDLQGLRKDGEFDLKDPEVLKGLVGSVVGKDAAERAVERTGEKEVKNQLVANTSKAFQAGAFGLPWFQCVNEKGEEEGFWGFDHLGQILGFLGIDEKADLGRTGGRRMGALL